MKVLVACEFSGKVRDAFLARGHDAISCDLLPTWNPGPHYQGDVLTLLSKAHFDLMIAHPPCNDLSISGNRYAAEKKLQREVALLFVMQLLSAKVEKIALENPVGAISTRIRKPDQVICPSQFGHSYSKRTCLWLKNLPLLQATSITAFQPISYVRSLPPSKYRTQYRSITFSGIAKAMAEQWG